MLRIVMSCLRKVIALVAIGCVHTCGFEAHAQYQAYTYGSSYGWYPYYSPQSTYTPPTYYSPYAMPYYYHPQFQYMPPTFMGAPYVPAPQAPPTLASSEAMQNASAEAQSPQLYIGAGSGSEKENKYGNALANEKSLTKDLLDDESSEKNSAIKASARNQRAMAAMSAPHRLNAMQYDRANHLINWPMTLRAPQFADVRYQLDKLFHERSPGNSGEKSPSANAIHEACQQMQDILKKEILELHPMEYIAAQQFIDSLAYEARFSERS
jgi:hypothetical protein